MGVSAVRRVTVLGFTNRCAVQFGLLLRGISRGGAALLRKSFPPGDGSFSRGRAQHVNRAPSLFADNWYRHCESSSSGVLRAGSRRSPRRGSAGEWYFTEHWLAGQGAWRATKLMAERLFSRRSNRVRACVLVRIAYAHSRKWRVGT